MPLSQYVEHRLPEPDAQARQQLMIAAGIATDKAVVILHLLAGEGEESRGAVIELVEKMRQAREQSA